MYVLLFSWDHEDGAGASALAVGSNKALLRQTMQEAAAALRREITAHEGDSVWNPDYTAYEEDAITLGYDSGGLPNIWRWELQQVGDPKPIRVTVVVDGGQVQTAFSDCPEQIDFQVADLDEAAAEEDAETSEAIYRAAQQAWQTLEQLY